MSRYVETPTRTFRAGAAIGKYLRVKLSSGKLAAAGLGANDEAVELGTLESPSFADGDLVPVRLRNAQGTCKMVASKAIDVGELVYGAASGKVSDAASGRALGQALEASTADGDVIEVLRYPGVTPVE